jgi:hypothetical protein
MKFVNLASLLSLVIATTTSAAEQPLRGTRVLEEDAEDSKLGVFVMPYHIMPCHIV